LDQGKLPPVMPCQARGSTSNLFKLPVAPSLMYFYYLNLSTNFKLRGCYLLVPRARALRFNFEPPSQSTAVSLLPGLGVT
jgi:hypothetical protein